MINKFSEIDKLFGAPINSIPNPKIPFKPKTWHYIAGAVGIGLALYGGYTLIQKLKPAKTKNALPDPLPHYPKLEVKQKPIITAPLPVENHEKGNEEEIIEE